MTPHLPILQVLVPLISAVLAAFCRRGATAWFIALAASWVSLAVTFLLLREVMSSAVPVSYVFGGWSVPFGIEYRVDRLNIYVLLIINLVGAAIMPYAARSVAKEIDTNNQAWFYCMYLLCLAGLLGIAVTGDAFNVFVFLEISSLSTYVLIALGRHRRALLASYQYLIIGTIGATLYVIGVGLLYVSTGSLNLADIATRLTTTPGEFSRPILAALAFLSAGICLKLALFPLHVWLPNAYAYAPSTATVFLAGTATKVAVYLLIRIYYSVYGQAYGFEALPVAQVLMMLSVAAMLLASFSAIFEANTKRLLAYSSVAQIGYITLGIALANTNGLTGGIVHLFNHAIMKSALFMALGAVYFRIGSVQLSDLAGIGRRMPITMAAFAIAALGLVGVPGTAGFISKWYLAVGAIEAGLWPIAFIIVASSVLAVVYAGKVIEVAYFREPSEAGRQASDPPLSMLVPLAVLAALTLYFGIDTRLNAGLAHNAAEMLLKALGT
ncbi:MAG: monovalent cation/H+ antiporter subunit D family protein [Alphaproteobacteria bacterium]|nr:monovalent cation/H+ antiporter subunit D family protein [Alphaproteobacteria bacterium]